MSDFPGNPHAENCRRSIAEAGESIIAPEGMTDGTIAWTGMTHLADATLALAYEQRTANLIAYWDAMSEGEEPWADTPFQRELDDMHRGIRTRLGRTAEVPK